MVRCREIIARSGEELVPVPGILVGTCSLRRANLLLLRTFDFFSFKSLQHFKNVLKKLL